jgi:hypothetical protein
MSKSAYGHVKEAQILGTLAPEEQEEMERLQRRKRLSLASSARRAALWDRAFDLHAERQQARAERAERIRLGEELL